jgi:hypothetical protein
MGELLFFKITHLTEWVGVGHLLTGWVEVGWGYISGSG